MEDQPVVNSHTPWVRIVLIVYIALSIVMCFNKLMLQKDYEVFVNEDGLPELEE